MEKQDYVVKRDQIIVGLLYDGLTKKPVQRIYFTLENNYTNGKDILNNKIYPCYNPNEYNENNLFICSGYNHELGVLLKYLGFKEDLTYDDILKIDEMFKYGWKFDNASLFGYFEGISDDELSYSSIDYRYAKFKSYYLSEDMGPIPCRLFDWVWQLSNPWDVKKDMEIDLFKQDNTRKLTR